MYVVCVLKTHIIASFKKNGKTKIELKKKNIYYN